jgi:fucose 4-O-acetylase-like acetyltransferase
MSNNERLVWLDAAKGIGIIFVVMGHIATGPLPARFIFSFHMPLFFFLSGVAFNFSRQEQFIRRRVRSLLVPYFFFCILSFLYWFMLERHFRPSDFDVTSAFLNIFFAQGGKYIFNSVMWFLPCLFVVEVCFYTVRRKVRSQAATALLVLACAVAGFALSGAEPFLRWFRLPVRVPWMLDTALVSIPFYALGAAPGSMPAVTTEGRRSVLVFVLIVAIVLCCGMAVFFPTRTDLAEFIFPNPVLFIIASCSGIAAVIAAAKYAPAPRLQALGRMSLVIMCIHEPIKRVLLKMAEVLSGICIVDLRAWTFTSVIMTAITLFFCIPPTLFICRFFPWIMGKKAR